MAIPVEASSLSQITEVASNPPRFPRNPTAAKREPLVLYIARVPGKKDVILTTLKPRLKNVTAEDVNSSLYYLHLDVPEDKTFAERHEIEDKYEGRSSMETIARKPLNSQVVASPQPSQFSTASGPSPLSPKVSSQIERKPVKSSEDSGILQPPLSDSTQQAITGNGLTQRRPLGSRPPQSQVSVVRKPLPSLPGIENAPLHHPRTPSNFETSNPRNYEPNHSFSITLIRRDPTSSSQWNIGKVVAEPDSETPYGPIHVYIDNPGYTKFQQTNLPQSPPMTLPNYSGFSRQVLMAWETSSNRRSRILIDKRMGERSSSDLTEHAVAPEFSNMGKAKGYVFLSPWNGECSFSTSAGGRSLKCRHTLSGNGMRIDTTDPTTHISTEVSELRFNLPNAAIFSQKTSTNRSVEIGRFAASKFNHIKNKLSSDSSKSSPSSPTTPIANQESSAPTSDDDEIEDYDESLDQLGQEKAGGGNRGKRVKLAKLIIQHEGLQMLDLLVAANMGIFWKIWHRQYG